MKHGSRWLGLLLVGTVACTACHARKEVKPPETAAPSSASKNANQEPSLRGKEYKEVAELHMVHFDLNEATLRKEDRDILQKNYDVIQRHPEWEFLVEGHCDERGTEAYNLGLGQRRATAVRQYYTNLGLGGSRIATLSYGSEQPLCAEHTEDCWSQNRRAVTKVRIPENAGTPQ